MSRFTLLTAALAIALGLSGMAKAGPMLTGAVTYDRSTQLYTYSYTLDDRFGLSPVDVVLIRVATHVYDLNNVNLVGYTAPAPFNKFYLSSAADVHGNEAVFSSGIVYVWDAVAAVAPDAGIYAGFSFTSRYGPRTGDDSNYELFAVASQYNAAHQYEARVEVGRVVAPELANAPEPGTLGLAIAGLAMVGFRGLRRTG